MLSVQRICKKKVEKTLKLRKKEIRARNEKNPEPNTYKQVEMHSKLAGSNSTTLIIQMKTHPLHLSVLVYRYLRVHAT